MRLDDLVALVDPAQTSLLLGAGASVSSGAPTGAQLARHLASKLSPSPDGEDLAEICGIYENRLGRKDLVAAIRQRLGTLQPTQGMLALPGFHWRAIYTTNFDRLVEDSYLTAGRDLQVVRSNYDFTGARPAAQVVLYKMHGCVTQDAADGSHSRMLLTEADYDEFAQYRQSLFNSLKLNMLTGDTMIIGQSLRDQHLRDLAKDVAALRDQGVQGRVFLLAYDYDDDRAQLFTQRGIQVAGGSLEDFLHALSTKSAARGRVAYSTATSAPDSLPPSLATTTLDARHAAGLAPNPVRLFNGSPATYADIRAGLTIRRAVERRLEETQRVGTRGFFLVLSGAAGVGKTSLARRLILQRVDEQFACWEHLNAFPLDPEGWLEVETRLRQAGRQGMLLIDDCAQHMTAVNRLVEALGAIDRPFLRLVLTVNAAQWRTRTKSKYFFSRGSLERISLLTDADIGEMVSLVDRETEIRKLVEADFLHLGHQDRIRRLRDRCSADMFVCLKNIFGSERLDEILLQEFAELEEAPRDVYRHVAVIQSMGGRVHRQLIMRLLGLEAGGVQTLLGQMEEVVDEYDIQPRLGLYGWGARHDVIAQVIATYKYADQRELFSLLERLIEGLNPTVHIEMETARSIASHEMGIPRLIDVAERVKLLEKLISVVPGERTPRRRLIRLYLDEGDLEGADRAIVVARRDIGQDDIVDRYRAILAMNRAEQSPGLLSEDRYAMLLEAERLARACILRRPNDRFNYRALGQVGVLLADRHRDPRLLDDAISAMKAAESDIADPDFSKERRALEARRRRFTAENVSPEESPESAIDSLDDALADSEG